MVRALHPKSPNSPCPPYLALVGAVIDPELLLPVLLLADRREVVVDLLLVPVLGDERVVRVVLDMICSEREREFKATLPINVGVSQRRSSAIGVRECEPKGNLLINSHSRVAGRVSTGDRAAGGLHSRHDIGEVSRHGVADTYVLIPVVAAEGQQALAVEAENAAGDDVGVDLVAELLWEGGGGAAERA